MVKALKKNSNSNMEENKKGNKIINVSTTSINKEVSLTRQEIRCLMIFFEKIQQAVIIGPSGIAAEMNVSRVTAHALLQRLFKKGLLKHVPKKGYILTKQGTRHARKFVRKHRILETYFYHFLNMDKNEACQCAKDFDYLVDDVIIDRMCAIMEHPGACIHGEEIPHDVNTCQSDSGP